MMYFTVLFFNKAFYLVLLLRAVIQRKLLIPGTGVCLSYQ